MSRQTKALEILKNTGTLMEGHFVGGLSDKHFRTAIRKENLLASPSDLDIMCELLVEQVFEAEDLAIEAVVGPASGGAVVASRVAFHLARRLGRTIKYGSLDKITNNHYQLCPIYRSIIGSQNILLVDDIISMPSELEAAYQALESTGAHVAGTAVLIQEAEIDKNSILQSVPHISLVYFSESGYDKDEVPEELAATPIGMTIDQSFNKNKYIIGVTGKNGAGKTTFTQTCTKLSNDTMTISVESVLRDTLDLWHIPATRYNSDRLSGLIQINRGSDMLANVIRKRILDSPYTYVFIDGIRSENIAALLYEFDHSILVHLEADDQQRYNRVIKRTEEPGDTNLLFEEFIQSETGVFEKNIDRLSKQADTTINNNSNWDALTEKAKQFMARLEAEAKQPAVKSASASSVLDN